MRAGWTANGIVGQNSDGVYVPIRTKVTVFIKDTVVPIDGTTIWATRTGAGTLGNPFTTALGVPPIFFCDPGQYDVRLEDADNAANFAVVPWEAVPGDDIPGPMILSDSLTATEIAPDAIGQSELAPNAVGAAEIIDGSVGTSELADQAITSRKVAAGVSGMVGATSVAAPPLDNTWTDSGLVLNLTPEVAGHILLWWQISFEILSGFQSGLKSRITVDGVALPEHGTDANFGQDAYISQPANNAWYKLHGHTRAALTAAAHVIKVQINSTNFLNGARGSTSFNPAGGAGDLHNLMWMLTV